MAFAPTAVNDHGVWVNLQPGQLMITIRGLVDLCDRKEIKKGTVERALIRLKEVAFTFQNPGQETGQETGQRKSIITVIEPSICESLKIESGTRNGTRNGTLTGQKQDINKNDKKDKNFKNKEDKSSFVETAAQLANTPAFDFSKGQFTGITPEHIVEWKQAFPLVNFDAEIVKCGLWVKHNPRKTKNRTRISKTITNWMQNAQTTAENKSMYQAQKAGETSPENAQKNKELAQSLHNRWVISVPYEILHNRIEFIGGSVNNPIVTEIRYSENGFENKLESALYKFNCVKK
jgi:hypothetical protein